MHPSLNQPLATSDANKPIPNSRTKNAQPNRSIISSTYFFLDKGEYKFYTSCHSENLTVTWF